MKSTVKVKAYDCIKRKPTTLEVSTKLKNFLDKKLGKKVDKGS